MADNSGSDKMSSQNDGKRNKDDKGDVSNKDILEHLVAMAQRIDSL